MYLPFTRLPLKPNLLLLLLICNIFVFRASTGRWHSRVTGSEITYTTTDSKTPLKDAAGNYVTIVYLEQLNVKKIGQNSNETDVSWLINQGYRVIELDYNNHPNTTGTKINQDIIAINNAIAHGDFGGKSNCSTYKSYILFEGYRIVRDLAYFKDNPNIYNTPPEYRDGDMLHMDIIYPENAKHQVPIILSFSYSNSFATFNEDTGKLTDANKNLRMHLGYTFAGFNDSLLEGAPAHGFAWAIADHPKYCPWGGGTPKNGANNAYKSYQTNPDTAQKVKSAIRTLRSKTKTLGLSETIGIYGFSRGSTAGSMAIGDKNVPVFEHAGFNIGVDDAVQAAALGPGVFDYTIIYNAKDDGDKNLEALCPLVWGDLKYNYEYWKTMGSEYLVESSKTAPVLFFYNTSDDAYYLEQISHLKTKLERLNVPNQTLINYGNGHAVPQKKTDLNIVYSFFKTHLNPPNVKLN